MSIKVGLYASIGNNDSGRSRFVKSLIKGLYEIENDVEYTIITHPEFGDWATKYSDEMKVVSRPWQGEYERTKAIFRPVIPFVKPYLKPIVNRYQERGSSDISIPAKNNFYNTIDVDIIHWLARYWEKSENKMVYNLGDVQDRHYPENFDDYTIEWRDTFCRKGSKQADAIITASKSVARDVENEYGVYPQKIHTIYRGPPTQYDKRSVSPQTVCNKYNIRPGFAFYPSSKWIHKNHDIILKSLRRLKTKENIRVSLVCTGPQSPKNRYKKLRKKTKQYELEDSVSWLGFVTSKELIALYKASGFLIFPSLFEGQGFPLVEAFDTGTAVICSDISPFREYGGEAPYYINPKSVSDITAAIKRLYSDEEYKRNLEEKSKKESKKYDWEITAEKYEEVYKSVATSG
jgi:glycosyltransferase involved in cell wall biosynthesis